jgi:hypothetical protein
MVVVGKQASSQCCSFRPYVCCFSTIILVITFEHPPWNHYRRVQPPSPHLGRALPGNRFRPPYLVGDRVVSLPHPTTKVR